MTEKLKGVMGHMADQYITIAVVVLCILLLRQLLKRYPRKYSYPLWAALGMHILGVRPWNLVRLNIFPNFSLTDGTWKEVSGLNNMVQSRAAAAGKRGGEIYIPVSSQTGFLADKGFQGQNLLEAAAVIWIGGLLLFFGYLFVSYIRMNRRVRFGIRLRDNIYECSAVESPFVLGILKPRIYLPVHMDKEQQTYVICHEEYHIRRRDYLIKPLAFLFLGLYWFHPMMWAAYICMCRDMEMSCDEHVLEKLGPDSRQAYSRTLLNLASGKGLPETLLGFGEHEVHGRIKNILKFRIPGKWSGIALTAVCIMVFVMLGCSEIVIGKDSGKDGKTVEAGSPSETAQKLYDASTPYVGDAAAVGNLLTVLNEYEIMPAGERTLELFTDEKPYGMAVHFGKAPENEDDFTEKMYNTGILCWALIGNLEDFQWSYPSAEEGEEIGTTYYLDEATLMAAFPGIAEIKEYGKSVKGIQELMETIGLEKKTVTSVIGGADGPTSIFIAGKTDRTDMDAAINACLLQKKQDAEEVSGSFQVYAHAVQDGTEIHEQEDGIYKLHLWTMYHEYDYDTRTGLQMLKNETKPVYMELKLSEQGEYQLQDYIEWTEENRGEKLWDQFSWADQYGEQMLQDCQKQAEEYTEMIAEAQEAIEKEK